MIKIKKARVPFKNFLRSVRLELMQFEIYNLQWRYNHRLTSIITRPLQRFVIFVRVHRSPRASGHAGYFNVYQTQTTKGHLVSSQNMSDMWNLLVQLKLYTVLNAMKLSRVHTNSCVHTYVLLVQKQIITSP